MIVDFPKKGKGGRTPPDPPSDPPSDPFEEMRRNVDKLEALATGRRLLAEVRIYESDKGIEGHAQILRSIDRLYVLKMILAAFFVAAEDEDEDR